MKITINGKELKEIVKGLSKVITSRVVIPALENVRIRGFRDFVTIEATDLDQTLVYKLQDAGTGKPEVFLVPFAELNNAARSIGASSRIELENEGPESVRMTTYIQDQAVSRTLEVLSAESFPDTLTLAPAEDYPLEEFLGAFRQVLTFRSSDPTRKVLHGVFVDSPDKIVVATDGKRLCQIEIPELPFADQAIVPVTKVLQNGVLNAETGRIALTGNDANTTCLQIQAGSWIYQCRCIGGTYPNYKSVIPEHQPNALKMEFAGKDIAVLKSALNQFPEAHDNEMSVYASPSTTVVLGPQANHFEPAILLPASHSLEEQDAVAFTVNRIFLIQAIDAGFRKFVMDDHCSPISSSSDGKNLHVLMPIRTDHLEVLKKHVHTRFDMAGNGLVPALQKQKTEEAAAEPIPESPEENTSEPITETPKKEESQMTNEQTITEAEKPAVENTDPLTQFLEELSTVQEQVRLAGSGLRELSKTAKALARDFRSQEQEVKSREQEVQKHFKMLSKLSEVMKAA